MNFLTILCQFILPPILAFFGVLAGCAITIRYLNANNHSRPKKPPYATFENHKKVGRK